MHILVPLRQQGVIADCYVRSAYLVGCLEVTIENHNFYIWNKHRQEINSYLVQMPTLFPSGSNLKTCLSK
jgi:hypothetical protein